MKSKIKFISFLLIIAMMLSLRVYLLRIRYIKSAIKAPSIMMANIVTLSSSVRRYALNVLFIAVITKSPTITINIKQTATSNGRSHFRDAYRISPPIMNVKKHPKIISNDESPFPLKLRVYSGQLCYSLRSSVTHPNA